ncbi:tyrosine-type recombinase/integrase [Enterococcus casseliflavus]|uniref:tyrosine-type recombinase/integrase n=1 Tax=Enterococcus casseliflavus TaxID=37734 RepID=UPI0035CA4D89
MEKLILKDLVEESAFSDRARGLSPKTINKHRKTLSLFLKFLEGKNVDSLGMVTVSHIRGFLIKNIEEGKAETYVNSHLRSIRAFFRYCVDENYIREKENPCLYVKWIKERQVVINTFSDDEVKKMLKYAKQRTFTNVKLKDKYHLGLQTKFTNERNYLLLLILVDTGLRISEVMNLKHYHVEESQIKVENGKGKKDRVVHCSPTVYKAYLKYLRVANVFFEYYGIMKDEYVFLTKYGRQYSYISAEREIKKIGVASDVNQNIRISPHTFRHYFTQKLVRNGADIYVIQKLLGHTSIKTTEVYLRSLNIDDSIEKAVKHSPLQTIK